MIKLENVNKIFKTTEVETTALSEIDIEIEMGEFVAVMGASGCGKSTLLNVVGMLDKPTSGSYWFLGKDITGFSEARLSEIRKSNIGFVFQSFNLIDELTIYENVELALLYHKVSAVERRNRVKSILEKLDILHRSNHFPSQLSGGQQQRAAVARALVAKPKLILADEPTGNLDSSNSAEVMSLLQKLNSDDGVTIVIVTHSESQALIAKRTINLLDGHIVQ